MGLKLISYNKFSYDFKYMSLEREARKTNGLTAD